VCPGGRAVFSAAYFDRSRYTTEEWSAGVLHVPGTGQARLVPVRVQDVPAAEVLAVLRPLVYRDLFGLGEEQVLLETVAGPRRPDQRPVFPGHGTRSAAVTGLGRPTSPAWRFPQGAAPPGLAMCNEPLLRVVVSSAVTGPRDERM
jgi:hypothetical protein